MAGVDGHPTLEVFESSTAIVEGRIIDVTGGFGKPTTIPDDPPPIPVTYVHIEVESSYRGTFPTVVRMLLPGGEVEDGTFVSAVGTPRVALDDRVLVAASIYPLDAHGQDVFLPSNWSTGLLVEDRASSAAPLVRDGQGRLMFANLEPIRNAAMDLSTDQAGQCSLDLADQHVSEDPSSAHLPLTWSELVDLVSLVGSAP